MAQLIEFNFSIVYILYCVVFRNPYNGFQSLSIMHPANRTALDSCIWSVYSTKSNFRYLANNISEFEILRMSRQKYINRFKRTKKHIGTAHRHNHIDWHFCCSMCSGWFFFSFFFFEMLYSLNDNMCTRGDGNFTAETIDVNNNRAEKSQRKK